MAQCQLMARQRLPCFFYLIIYLQNEGVLYFIEQHKLMSRSIGYLDTHLLAPVFLQAGTKLWTEDKRLAQIASELRGGMSNIDTNGHIAYAINYREVSTYEC